jgi:diguanylate cyclase (GGDEF)-like protein/PAS domain S-box-containing protein
LTSSPSRPPARQSQGPLGEALRFVHIALGLGFALACVSNAAFGVWATAAATGAAALMMLAAWRIAQSGRVDLSAAVTFYTLCAILAVLAVVGHGTRDYSLIAIGASVFAASVFLKPRAYWTLGALAVAGMAALAVAEMHGWYVPRAVPATGARELLNLVILVVAATFGGRGLMVAIRSAIAREAALSGELRSSEDRIQKLFRSSQNPIVVSRLEDGKYLEVNDAYLALFGYRRDEVIGRSAVDLRVWEDADEREQFVRLMRGRGGVREFETRMRKRTGEIMEVQLSAELAELGGDSCLLVSVADVSARRHAERRAQQLATRDALTGLPNRVAARDRLQLAVNRAAATGRPVAVLHLDIDRFKSVNESMGYAAGDTLIRQVAGRLDASMAPGDTLARIAGDEFLVIAESLRDPAGAEDLARRLAAEMQKPFLVDGRELRVALTTGIGLGPDYAIDADRLLRRADTAMHAAKREARGGWRLYDRAMSERVRDRFFIESSLRGGIARGELRLLYQPKFSLDSGEVKGLEALVRWHHPELGEVAPSAFIPIAEESDAIHELGAWVLGEASGQIARWRDQGLAVVPVAVNLSAPQFTPELPLLVAERTRAHGIAPELIEIEVTESLLIKNPEAARRLLQQITARGSRVMLDDFGVGYSSLGYVKQLELNGIKIDRSFVRDLVGSRHDAAIVKAIVGLAHGLGLVVVAEGVETQAQAELLKDLGCDEAQGFHFSRPVGGEEVARRFLAASAASRLAV